MALRESSQWKSAIKVSENPIKIPNPGNKRVWRVYDARGKATADVLGLEDEDLDSVQEIILRHPIERDKRRILARDEISGIESLLVNVLDEGRLVHDLPSMDEMRHHRQADLERLDSGVQRLINPPIYHFSLTQRLWQRKQELIRSARAQSDRAEGK